jgi:hypothetical protein
MSKQQYITDNTNRLLAMEWWKSLPSNTQLEFWRQYQETTFTPSGSPDQLTGREIEAIWKANKP